MCPVAIPEDLDLSGINQTLGGSVRSLPPERPVNRNRADFDLCFRFLFYFAGNPFITNPAVPSTASALALASLPAPTPLQLLAPPQPCPCAVTVPPRQHRRASLTVSPCPASHAAQAHHCSASPCSKDPPACLRSRRAELQCPSATVSPRRRDSQPQCHPHQAPVRPYHHALSIHISTSL